MSALTWSPLLGGNQTCSQTLPQLPWGQSQPESCPHLLHPLLQGTAQGDVLLWFSGELLTTGLASEKAGARRCLGDPEGTRLHGKGWTT